MKNFILLSILVAGLAACSKKVEELPPATTTGANTFGASVKGALWTPRGKGIIPTAPILEANFAGNNSYIINARNFGSTPNESEIELFLYNVTAPGTYALNTSTSSGVNAIASYGLYIERKVSPIGNWITDPQHTGSITVTRLDPVAKIISGTFYFTGKDIMGTAGPVTVTEGRFDVKIQ